MILSRAPLRVPLGGGGTDLPSYYSKYGGFVLSAAINKYVYICINRPAADDLIRPNTRDTSRSVLPMKSSTTCCGRRSSK